MRERKRGARGVGWWIGATEKKRHISHASRRNEERENPTDFPRGMQIRIEISRENVKDPMRFVRVAARCERLARARTPLEIIIRSLLSRARGKGRDGAHRRETQV